MNISNHLNQVIKEIKRIKDKVKIREDQPPEIENMLEYIISIRPFIKCEINMSDIYEYEEIVLFNNLEKAGSNGEELKKYVTKGYLQNNAYALFDFFEKFLKLYRSSNEDVKKELIEHGLNAPEFLLEQDFIRVIL